MEFYGQCVLRVKLFSSAAYSNSRKKSDYMLYNFFIRLMKTHENFLSEDLHRKTFGNGKFVRFCDVKKYWGSLIKSFLFQFLGILINQVKKGHLCYRVYLNLRPVIKNGSKLLPPYLSLKTEIRKKIDFIKLPHFFDLTKSNKFTMSKTFYEIGLQLKWFCKFLSTR